KEQREFSHLSTSYNREKPPFHPGSGRTARRIEFVDLTKFGVLRSPDRPSAAARGGRNVLNAQPVSSAPLQTGSSAFETFLRETGPSAKVVLGILLFFSLVSWLIIIAKYIRLKRVRGQSNRFLDFFRKS